MFHVCVHIVHFFCLLVNVVKYLLTFWVSAFLDHGCEISFAAKLNAYSWARGLDIDFFRLVFYG